MAIELVQDLEQLPVRESNGQSVRSGSSRTPGLDITAQIPWICWRRGKLLVTAMLGR